jgi:putative spermidine/putrescine transport system substrate-binding protein
MRKLNEFSPHVTGFASSYGAATQLILDGEADMIYLPDNRYFAAVREGANYGFTYNQAIMNFDCMVVPKSSENKELAMKILAKIISPEINASIVTSSGLSPSNVRSITEGHVPEDLAKDLAMAPHNLEKIVMADNNWWSENHQKLRLQERYDEFKAR